jgi:two-component system NtrC family sensor kinase
MRTARQSAIRLLRLMMVASIVLPAVLFALACWVNYRHEMVVADERIERSLDILHEHALKVFQTVERAMAEVQEILRGYSDEEALAQQPRLHARLRQIVAAMPQVQAMIVIDRNGHSIASSSLLPIDTGVEFSDREYFRVHSREDIGTHVSGVLSPRLPGFAANFFNLSRRRESADGSFNGIIAIALLPDYLTEFYARIGRAPGSYYSMIRADGAVLARYPSNADTPRRLDLNSSGLGAAIARDPQFGLYTSVAQLDQVERRFGYRKLAGFDIYVLAGTETSAIRAEWLSTMTSHLIFGLPATLLLFGIIGLALQRTRRLYAEGERREVADAALRQAQRLQAIGQLTGGVAHDFNNLLMVVGGSVQRLRRDLSGEKHLRLLDMITTATERGESLTRQLLTFSRRQMLTPAVIDLGRRLPELKDLLNRSLRGDIEIKVVVPNTACAVKVDPSELELALLNLAVNARDAMPNGGTLSITAKPVVLRGQAAEEGLNGEFVAIRLADTGTGIPKDILPHVFEPFFTTKEVGKGTGLGLSQVYGFARQSGGTATITSTVGRGTVITLYLPRTHESPAVPAAREQPEVAARRAGAVLLVEDNDEVAEVCQSYFQQLGYTTRRAASAQEALGILEDGADVDLVFSDILMPGLMNGLDLAHAVRDRFPRLPVLLTTGYSNSIQDALQQDFVVLQKPFDLAELEQTLRTVIPAKDRRDGATTERAVG